MEVDMKKRLLITLLVAFLAAAATGPSGSNRVLANDPAPGSLLPAINQAMLDAIPEPADDPMLDASGAVVLDSSGKPVSDPNEGFHKVIPAVFDPAGTHLVQSTWLDGIGCPTNATVAAYPSNSPTGTYTDPACDPALLRPGDPKDNHNEGLLLVKTGPTNNNASAGAELKKVRGITLTEVGYDIRKNGAGTHSGPYGSHCDGGAPRFNITTTNAFFFLACASPPPDTESIGNGGWIRLRWGGTVPLTAYCIATADTPVGYCDTPFTLRTVTGTVKRIQIVFDEGTDTAAPPDQFGLAVLDNIDVNGVLVGRGPAGPGMGEDKSNDDDDDD